MPAGENGNISVRQFTILVFLYSVGTTILVIPSSLAEVAKQDAWIAAVLGVGLALLLVRLYSAVGNLFPGLTLIETNEQLLGKWCGKAVSLLLVFFALITASELLYFMGTFMTTQIMPETPIQAINILFALVVIMGVRLGLEVLARSAEILFPCFVALFLGLILYIAPQIEIHNIQPVFETGIKPLIFATLLFISVFSLPAVLFLMVFPVSINEPQKAQKAFYIGTLLAGIVLILVIASSILVLGADTTSRQMYPSYVLAKKINIGNFLQHIEVIVAVMWFITIYLKMAIYFYVSVKGLALILHLKEYRPLVMPMGLILVAFSLIIHPNIVHSNIYNKETWLPFVSTFGFALPLLLLAAASFQKKQKVKSSDQCSQGSE
ncbi:endospore germination permease [Paenibacillus sp. MER TA 81-3]|uniref:GerAB/ArcD/ProY family transporter n=1 Tax=Paenibacillus sp. MER TA 81-3 TaxID=2939573 RepID=UPI00203C2D6B|nr:endospore germination permease [Paenibacillus sp. MER TA 81-3]MCM3339789.1 endospore germination permease [Paenibacillus sp. MER TA 81-3]